MSLFSCQEFALRSTFTFATFIFLLLLLLLLPLWPLPERSRSESESESNSRGLRAWSELAQNQLHRPLGSHLSSPILISIPIPIQVNLTSPLFASYDHESYNLLCVWVEEFSFVSSLVTRYVCMYLSINLFISFSLEFAFAFAFAFVFEFEFKLRLPTLTIE